MKTKKDNDVIKPANTISVYNETKLLWPIGQSVIYDENNTR